MPPRQMSSPAGKPAEASAKAGSRYEFILRLLKGCKASAANTFHKLEEGIRQGRPAGFPLLSLTQTRYSLHRTFDQYSSSLKKKSSLEG